MPVVPEKNFSEDAVALMVERLLLGSMLLDDSYEDKLVEFVQQHTGGRVMIGFENGQQFMLVVHEEKD